MYLLGDKAAEKLKALFSLNPKTTSRDNVFRGHGAEMAFVRVDALTDDTYIGFVQIYDLGTDTWEDLEDEIKVYGEELEIDTRYVCMFLADDDDDVWYYPIVSGSESFPAKITAVEHGTMACSFIEQEWDGGWSDKSGGVTGDNAYEANDVPNPPVDKVVQLYKQGSDYVYFYCCGEDKEFVEGDFTEILSISANWVSGCDMDIGVQWQGESVGWTCGGSTYMIWDGDSTACSDGTEHVSVDVGQTLHDAVWDTETTIEVFADWWTPVWDAEANQDVELVVSLFGDTQTCTVTAGNTAGCPVTHVCTITVQEDFTFTIDCSPSGGGGGGGANRNIFWDGTDDLEWTTGESLLYQ